MVEEPTFDASDAVWSPAALRNITEVRLYRPRRWARWLPRRWRYRMVELASHDGLPGGSTVQLTWTDDGTIRFHVDPGG